MQDLADRLIAAQRIHLFAIDQARARAHVQGQSVADVLVESGAIPEPELLRFMARELGTRFVVADTLRRTHISAAASRILPVEIAEKYCAVVVQVNAAERSVGVVMADPRQAHALDVVPDVARMDAVNAVVALPSAIKALIRAVYYDDRSALFPPAESAVDAVKCPHCAQPVRSGQLQCGACGIILSEEGEDSGWAADEPSVIRRLIADTGGRHELPAEGRTQPRAIVFSPQGRGEAVPRLRPGLDILDRPLSEFEAYVAAFVDGVLTVSEIANEACISELETESVIVSLAERGIVDFASGGIPSFDDTPEPRTMPAAATVQRLAAAEARSAAEQPEPPSRTRNVLEMALALERSGATKEAIAFLQEEIAREPNAAPLLNRLAVTLLKQRNFSEAEALLRRATELEPGNDVFRKNLRSVRTRISAEAKKPAPIEDRF